MGNEIEKIVDMVPTGNGSFVPSTPAKSTGPSAGPGSVAVGADGAQVSALDGAKILSGPETTENTTKNVTMGDVTVNGNVTVVEAPKQAADANNLGSSKLATFAESALNPIGSAAKALNNQFGLG